MQDDLSEHQGSKNPEQNHFKHQSQSWFGSLGLALHFETVISPAETMIIQWAMGSGEPQAGPAQMSVEKYPTSQPTKSY